MNNDNHVNIADLRILDPDAAAEIDEQAKAKTSGPPLPHRSALPGSRSQPAPRRSQFGASEAGEAKFLRARHMHRLGELAEEMGLYTPYVPAGSTSVAPQTNEEVEAVRQQDAVRAEKKRLKREYNRRHKAKQPHQLAFGKAKGHLAKAKASLENTQRELAKIEAAKVEIKTRPGYEREIELMHIVGKEAVWQNALRASLRAIEKWERELPALQQAAEAECGNRQEEAR